VCGTPITLAGSPHRDGIAGFIVIARFADPMDAPALSFQCRTG
jgi:hypothetical protein